MQPLMQIALESLQQDAARLDRISANVANSTTPGYKREVLAPQAAVNAGGFAAMVEADGTAAANVVVRDHRPGTLRETRQKLDLAIAGPGYFEVVTPQGRAYTRNGQFHVDGRGQLVSAQGHPVQGDSGPIVLSSASPVIDEAGVVRDDGRVVGQLRIVAFDDPGTMQYVDGFFRSSSQGQPTNAATTQVKQGHLENANVSSMQETIDLMRTMRHFESVHRAVQTYDEMMGSAIRKLGDL